MMDSDRSKEELLKELIELRGRIAELETSVPEKNEEKFRTLAENINVGIYRNTVGPKGKFIEANPAIVKMFGYQSKEEFLSQDVADLYQNPEDRRRFNQKMLRDGFVSDEILQLSKKDGSPFYGSVSAVAVKGEGGEVKYYDGIIEDITERMRIEESLKRQTQLQEQLLVTARYLTASLDVKEVLTRIANTAREILEARGCEIYLLEENKKTLNPVVAIEPPYDEKILATPLDVDQSLTGQAVKEKRGLIFNDVSENPYGQSIPGVPDEKDERIITAPFIVENDVLGAMSLNRIGLEFDKDDLALAETFATYAATALRNAQTYQQLQVEVKERLRADQALLKEKAYLEQLFGSAQEAIVMCDNDGRVQNANTEFLTLFGYELDEIVGRFVDELVAPKDKLGDAVSITRDVVLGARKALETIRQRKDGELVNVSVLAAPIIVGSKQVGVYGIYRDITDRKRWEKELRALSLVDDLTKLYNRRGFTALAKQQIILADRTNRSAITLFVDLDNMKWINDNFGHQEGDRALIAVANILKRTFRRSDIIARFGGDEFVVFAIEAATYSNGALIIRLNTNLDQYNKKANLPYRLSLSIGAATYNPKNPCSIEDLIARADAAMYEQKKSKKKE